VIITIYHNPRCSKSRQTLALIEEQGIKPDIIEYLNSPPSEAELDSILTKLGKEPAELLRTGEEEYKLYFKGRDLSRDEAISLMVQHPKVIERPIVVANGQARIGRPPESVLEIL
jgi:arsenate reductase